MGQKVCTRPELFWKEIKHLREALSSVNTLDRPSTRFKTNILTTTGRIITTTTTTNKTTQHEVTTIPAVTQREAPTRGEPNVGHVVIPYIKKLGEGFKKICGKNGTQTYFKGNIIIKQLFMKPKNHNPLENKSEVIYSYQCGDITCSEEYIGETSRKLGERYKEHLKQPSPIYAHSQ